MDWREVPSLSALRAFEAAARTGSLSAAARELNVTHAAISQHVRTLEAHFGRALIGRDGQRMVPTAEGAELAGALGEGFGRIAAGVRDLLAIDRLRPLRVALTPSLAANWLLPRIGRFWAAHPDVHVELLPSPALVDLTRDDVDVAIRYGKGGWPGTDPKVLMPVGHAAVAAPGYVRTKPKGLADLAGVTWLLDGQSSEERLWAQEQGLDMAGETVKTFNSLDLAREAAVAGLGVTILPMLYLETPLRQGALELLVREEVSPIAYHILTRPGPPNPGRDPFIRWLREMAAETPV
ncbi:LysR family transcriptional regulator [Wenxinia marina]|uniref:Transcriptional regulator, LysR family n=1 Tax=Wenxinia marina DSM 24838 TaxID=1123501 RepID=A0A0D0QJ71_9RHOB|nr:LysR family transcriptional regulator [Wenxinia marina]KIQ71088.1 transcriptional regulator, LysR family [Wenxinia marina DSM 24838]GGL54935.1 DNA-binding transcriptional activator GcvA [Wenxinia marina]